jgi:hypothetical protein
MGSYWDRNAGDLTDDLQLVRTLPVQLEYQLQN